MNREVEGDRLASSSNFSAAMTLELPAGHVEQDETPEESARKELLEETGHVAEKFELLASLSPSTSRFTNRMW